MKILGEVNMLSMREDLDKIIKDLKKEKNPKIAIFLPSSPEAFDTYNSFLFNLIKRECLEKEFRVIPINSVFLNSYEGMKLIDILLILDGTKIPLYYLPRIKNFIHRGGAIIVLSKDDPFKNLEELKNRSGLTNYLLEGKFDEDNFYRRTTAYMGVKTYTSDIPPNKSIFDRDFLPELPETMEINLSCKGIYCNTSSDKFIPYPPYGNVFPERYERLRNYIVVKGTDEFKMPLVSSVVFTQNWENGSRMVFITLNENKEIFDKYLSKIIRAAMLFCLNKTFISFIEPDYACYRDGETVKIKCEVMNFSDFLIRAKLNLEIEGELGDFVNESKDISVNPRDGLKCEFYWTPKEFLSDFYTIKSRLIINERIVSKAENGFVVWKDKVDFSKKNHLEIQGRYFLYNDKPTVITGTNYYESHIGELMWLRPNIKKLRDDLKAMADNGINYVRIHYHHPKWFLDYLKQSIKQIPPYFKEVIFDQGYLPNEKMWRIFDAHIYLCQKFGIIYGGDLLTLVPEEMGDPLGWIGVQDRIYLNEKIKAQEEFLKLLVKRYKDVGGIIWDLWNEPEELDIKRVLNWARKIKGILRENGDLHPITIGTGRTFEYEDVVDLYADHRNFKSISSVKTNISKPLIMQEVWMDHPQTLEGDKEQAKDMFQALLDTFRLGLSGFVPWQWTNQARLWNDYRVTYHELWDDRLGCCVRDDGTLKPAGRIYRDFSILMKTVKPYKYSEGKTYTDRGILEVFSSKGEETNFGKAYLVHYKLNSNSLYAGIIANHIKIEDKVYMEARDNIIWFFTGDEKDINQSNEIYVKVSNPGNLRIFYRVDEISYLAIAKYTLEGWELLSDIEISRDKNFIEIQILPWYINYWIKIKF